ncbi:MAG TPA: hypothetical protein VEZ71_21050, partial [Archangium sp.]|nr:hypothetical protein [Archangium sp.]
PTPDEVALRHDNLRAVIDDGRAWSVAYDKADALNALARLRDGAARAKALEEKAGQLDEFRQHLEPWQREDEKGQFGWRGHVFSAIDTERELVEAIRHGLPTYAWNDGPHEVVSHLLREVEDAESERNAARQEAKAAGALAVERGAELDALRERVATLEREKEERKAGLQTMQTMVREAVDAREAAERREAETRARLEAVRAVVLEVDANNGPGEVRVTRESWRRLKVAVEGISATTPPAPAPLLEAVKRAESFAKYHDERASYGGASREFHERAASFLRTVVPDVAALAAHDAAKGGEDVNADKARRWDAAVERAKDADAMRRSWYGLNVKADVADRAVRYVLGLDTPPSGPGGGESEEYQHVEADDGTCALTCPACLQEDTTAPLTPESLAAHEHSSLKQCDPSCPGWETTLPAPRPATITHATLAAAALATLENPTGNVGCHYVDCCASAVDEVLRRATNGQAPRVLLESRVVGVLAEWLDAYPHVLAPIAKALGLTLPDAMATRTQCGTCGEHPRAVGLSVCEGCARGVFRATATHHGGPEAQSREAPVDPTPNTPPLTGYRTCGNAACTHPSMPPEATRCSACDWGLGPKHGGTPTPEVPAVVVEPAAPEVVWEGEGSKVFTDGTLKGSPDWTWKSIAGHLARALAEAKREKRKAAEDMREKVRGFILAAPSAGKLHPAVAESLAQGIAGLPTEVE